MRYTPKNAPEHINVTPVHPLAQVAKLFGTGVLVFFALLLALWGFSDLVVTYLPESLEQRIGAHICEQAREEGDYAAAQQYLEQLSARLWGTRERTAPQCITIIHDESANAFAFIGMLGVTTQFLAKVESENELAFVLAHELGHHAHRDALYGLGRQLAFSAILAGVGWGEGSTDLAELLGEATFMQHSREQEQQADLFAIERIQDTYGHIGQALRFFERVAQEEGALEHSTMAQFFSTHPAITARIADMQRYAEQNNWMLSGEITPLPDSLAAFREAGDSTSQNL